MPAMYDKPVRILMQEMIPALGLSPGDTFTREQAVQWFSENYPKIETGHRRCTLGPSLDQCADQTAIQRSARRIG